MALFRYQALNADEQLVTGELSADTVADAVAQLESEGLIVQSIGFATTDSRNASTPNPQSFIHQSDASGDDSLARGIEREVLRSHLDTVLNQGATITPALRAYADEMPSGRRRRQLKAVCEVIDRADVAGAESALASLPEYWIPLLSAAASSNDPGRVLREFLEESRSTDELRRQWWLTLAYPLVVAAIAAIVFTALSFVVIPIFRNIFQEFDLTLPWLTRFVLFLSQWITSVWSLVVLILLIAVGAILWRSRRWPLLEMPMWLSRFLRLPLGRSTALARLARFTADLLEAGLPVHDALRIASYSSRTPSLRRSAWRVANEIESQSAFVGQSPYPLSATLVYALRADVLPESRIRLLREVSTCHAEHARMRLSWTRGIIEPIAICVIGLIVASTVVALYMPLVRLVEGLSR